MVTLSMPAECTILYSNGTVQMGGAGQDITNYEGAESFTLSASATLEGARIFIHPIANVLPASFTWAIYSNNTFYPGSMIATGQNPAFSATLVGLFEGSYTYYQYDFNLPDVALSAGTYWLSASFGGNGAIWEQSTTPNAQLAASRPLAGSWTLVALQLPLAVADAPLVAPEPSSGLLLAIGMAGIVGRRLRRVPQMHADPRRY